jgi:hypothetical protein
MLHEGLPRELAKRLERADPSTRRRKIGRTWILSADPHVYLAVVRNWLAEEKNITVWRHSTVSSVTVDNGRITSLALVKASRVRRLEPGAVIDASGSAEVVRLAAPELLNDVKGAAAGLIFQLRGMVPGALAFPKSVEVLLNIRRAVRQGELPSECAQAWLDTGVYKDEAYVKLSVPLGSRWREPLTRARKVRRALYVRDRLLDFLSRLEGFTAAKLVNTGELGIRDSGRVEGEYCLTAEDVRQGRKFADTAARCAWPIEFWDAAGGVSLEYLTAGNYYEIPLAALSVRGFCKLWAVGKCLSAQPQAQASARVAGCCWAMGEAAGGAAGKRSNT